MRKFKCQIMKEIKRYEKTGEKKGEWEKAK